MDTRPTTKLDSTTTPSNTTATFTSTPTDIKIVAIPVSTLQSLNYDPETLLPLSTPSSSPPTTTSISPPSQKSSWLSNKYKSLKLAQQKGSTRMVRMPVSEYERFWARDGGSGKYCGSEPEGCEEGLKLLEMRLADREMQGWGKRDVSTVLVLRSCSVLYLVIFYLCSRSRRVGFGIVSIFDSTSNSFFLFSSRCLWRKSTENIHVSVMC